MLSTHVRPLALVGRKHDALHRPAELVADFDEAAALAERMRATLAGARGLAIAAPQVGRSLRIVVTPTLTLVNPVIEELRGEVVTGTEGCLSLPGRWYAVPRHTQATVVGTTVDGEPIRVVATDALQARMWQHELEHLDGVLLAGRFPEVRA